MLKSIKIVGNMNFIIFGIILLLLSIVRMPFNNQPLIDRYAEYGYNFNLLLLGYGQLLIFSIFYMVTGYGVINGKKWSRSKTLLTALASLIVNVILVALVQVNFNVMAGSFESGKIILKFRPLHMIGGIIYPIFLLIYFNSKKVKEYYVGLEE